MVPAWPSLCRDVQVREGMKAEQVKVHPLSCLLFGDFDVWMGSDLKIQMALLCQWLG